MVELTNSCAVSKMSVGVVLRTEIVDASGAPSSVVETDGALRVHAANLGIISFAAHLATQVIGNSVTDRAYSGEWEVMLMLPGSSGAKTEDQEDTKLVVTTPGQRVAFHTTGTLTHLISQDSGWYKSGSLDVFGTTA